MSTWLELKTEIMDEYDLNEEVFISPAELLRSANNAISDIEKHIHALDDNGSKYFHTEASLPLILDEDSYDLPEDIYANKITGMVYNDGVTKYEILPIRTSQEILEVMPNDNYKYKITSTAADGMKIKLYPPSREDSLANVTVFYRRKANRIADDSTYIDIPEGEEFIKQWVIEKAANKERMTPDAPESAELTRKRNLLIGSLTNQIDDENNQVPIDLSFYEGSV